MNLIIIGNGFDLNHRLKTAYSDFRDFIKDIKNDLLTIEVLDSLYNLGDEWCEFEEGLGLIKETPEANKTISLLGVMGIKAFTEKLHDYFRDWVASIC